MNAPTTSPTDQSAIAQESQTAAPEPRTAELGAPAPGVNAPAPDANAPAPGAVAAAPGAVAAGLGADAPSPGADSPAGVEPAAPQPRAPGFRERARMRRRVRFLRKARELAYRDLGGLVFEMQRSGQRNDELVAAKLGVLASFDTELRALEAALGERQPLTVLREAGIAACPRCAAIHGSDDRFCPMCGMAMGRQPESPIAATPPPAVATVQATPVAGELASAPSPTSLAAASVAAASTVTPGQLALSAATGSPPARATDAPPAPATSNAAPTSARPLAPAPTGTPGPPPAPGAPPAAGANPVRAPTPVQDDRPTEIIRPRDDESQ